MFSTTLMTNGRDWLGLTSSTRCSPKPSTPSSAVQVTRLKVTS